MKLILIGLIFLTNIFALPKLNNNILSAKEAFVISYDIQEGATILTIKLAKDIYVYKKKLKLIVDKKDRTDIFSSLKTVNLHDADVVQESFTRVLPKGSEYSFSLQGCSKSGVCYYPITKNFTNNTTEQTATTKVVADESDKIMDILLNKNIFIILGAFFLYGLLLSLTPCTFPMIPILSSIIVNSNKKETISAKKGFFLSLVYVLSVSFTYSIAGVIVAHLGSNIQAAMQQDGVVIAFSAIFILLSFSMFGYFKLELPQSIQTKLNAKTQGNTGILGIIIMGVLSALIVGPCIAPPLGAALLFIAQSGDVFVGALALFILSMGMGVPLLLIGLGAGKLLPHAGTWMDLISKFFGIIMLAIAILMLSKILDSNIINILWATLLIVSAIFYGALEPIEEGRKDIFKILKAFWVITLIVGASMIFKTIVANPEMSTNSTKISEKKINRFKIVTTNEQLSESLQSNNYVIVDFWAKWCNICEELEETFHKSKVQNELIKFKLVKVDLTDMTKESESLLKRFDIFGPPMVGIFKDGKLIKKFIGYKNEKEFLEFLKI